MNRHERRRAAAIARLGRDPVQIAARVAILSDTAIGATLIAPDGNQVYLDRQQLESLATSTTSGEVH